MAKIWTSYNIKVWCVKDIPLSDLFPLKKICKLKKLISQNRTYYKTYLLQTDRHLKNKIQHTLKIEVAGDNCLYH